MSRYTKTDWLDLGLELLVTDGPSAIRIETLCQRAGRTKGSFYHHFKTRADFTAALMEHWEGRLTARVIKKTETQATPVAKLIALNELTMDMEYDLERALRQWAGADSDVATVVARVDKRRVDYVASLLMQAKNISSRQAIDLAVMNYAALIGFQLMFTPISEERRRRIDRMFVDILGGLPDHE